MDDKMLSVVFDATVARRKVAVPRRSTEYIKLLARQGYGYVEYVGLAALGAKVQDGKSIDRYFSSIDDDVAFLLENYLHLERVVAAGGADRVRTCVADGIFDFDAAIVSSEIAHVRVGIYPLGDEFKAPYLDGVMVDVQTYLTMWRSVASTIVSRAEGHPLS